MKQLTYLQAIRPATEALSAGRALLTAAGEPDNAMTIAWGSIGYYWNKPVFTVVVRPQRHTYGLLLKAGDFCVSLATKNDLRAPLAFAGKQSGRDFNKFEGHGLTKGKAIGVKAPIVLECGLHFECKTLLVQPMTADQMAQSVIDSAYPARDFHIMFMGEIVNVYTTDE